MARRFPIVRRAIRLLFAAASICGPIVSAACATHAPPPAPTAARIVTVIGTNDLHGAVTGGGGRGGLALLDGFVGNVRAARQADGGAVILLDAGDLFQGTLESNLNEGAVVIAAYNAIGYSASTIGNHEFDYGPAGPPATPQGAADDPRGALKARIVEAHFPFVASNIIDRATGAPVGWPNVSPSTILDADGVRVGVVGLATDETLAATMAANTRGLSIAPLASTLTAEAVRLRKAGASLVIAVAHAGGRCTVLNDPRDTSSCNDDEIFAVARAQPAGLVDAIVAGHRHAGIAHVVNGIAIIESFTGGRAFGRIDFTVDRATGRVRSRHVFPPRDVCEREDAATGACVSDAPPGSRPVGYEGRPVVLSQEIAGILAPAVARADEVRGRSLNAFLETPFLRSGTEESPLGNLETDWMRAMAGTDVAIANGGGLRADLPAGEITYGRLYALLPFDNREVRVMLTGAQLRRIVAHNLQTDGSMLLVSGVRASARCGADGLHVTLWRASGEAIADRDTLTVITSDFLADGGDDFFAPVMPLPFRPPGAILREELAAWLMRSGRRWRAADVMPPGSRRIAFEGKRPVTC